MRLIVLGGTQFRCCSRARLIAGLHDPVGRRGWWLARIASAGRAAAGACDTWGGGRRVVVPDALDQPMALVDGRDLAAWPVRGVEEGWSGGVNAPAPAGSTTLGELLETCASVVGARLPAAAGAR